MTPEPDRSHLRDTVLLLARQRSGTNALQAALSTHPDIHCTREVFHDAPEEHPHLDQERNFFRFLEQRGAPAARGSAQAQERLFLDYLALLRTSTDKRFLVVDVKLNATHHFDGPWRPLVGHPALFGLAARHRLRVLHLVRANGLRTVVSAIKARRTQRWIEQGGGPAEDIRVEVPVARLVSALWGARGEDELVRTAFEPRGDYLRVEYAELFGDLPAGVGGIARWLGADDAPAVGDLEVRKQASLPLEETISNFDEVRRVLTGTPFESFLEDERLG